ncbi:secretion protein HlyD family protein [Ferrimonas balearica DSM 9799]|uniref:Secretion protein HlyD family protein n=1 Tax=Ferrimonas balearica (strain DSM 9799 / CCM 4581 / KCTC 23876 / PAT) TaxID=550540 RepID=E1SWQ4_FERBD|nr:efflux RND transporter periplasmic adaptor subunit [Ferrimonas balearica]ADN77516.1 secretion protein HlyD family protein [Ferrimonas balearica DSM 9799]MBY6107856.1 efflux RND transporter periplasmic adaptor subunit [Ferrimonas balearica]
MDLLLILTYAALCVGIFKVFNIPLNKWTVPTAVLGGVVLIGTLLLLMNYNHPFTPLARQVYVATPIVPTVRGIVVEVPVQPNQPLSKGDVLFRIDDARFRDEVDRYLAELTAAESERDRTLAAFKRYEEGFKRGGAFTELELDNRRQLYLTAEAQVQRTKALLDKAQVDLTETVVRAPQDGYVTQVALRPGMMAVPLPLRPVMVFINEEDDRFVGAFNQKSLLRLQSGYEAEVIFEAIPGRVFKAQVAQVLPNIAEGQIQASGTLLSSDLLVRRGRAFVEVQLLDDISELGLPDGAHAEIAVYSDKFSHVSIIRRVLLRMKSWQNYLFLEH